MPGRLAAGSVFHGWLSRGPRDASVPLPGEHQGKINIEAFLPSLSTLNPLGSLNQLQFVSVREKEQRSVGGIRYEVRSRGRSSPDSLDF